MQHAGNDYEFLIIGGGIAGASAAYFLSRAGKVALIEQERALGYHSTGRSAALFGLGQGDPAVVALSILSRPFFEQPPAGFADVPLLHPRGTMILGNNANQVALAPLVARGCRLLTAAQACDLVPILNPAAFSIAALDEAVTDIDVDALHAAYVRGARANGAELMLSTPLHGLSHDGANWHATSHGRVISASVVVNAAGAWADEVATMAGTCALGIEPLRRTAIIIAPPAGVDVTRWPAVASIAPDLYFKPEAGKLMASPSDETLCAAQDIQPEELDIAVCIDRLQQVTTLEIRRPTHKWAGLRNFARDRRPVVGFDAGVPNFFWLAGQGGAGIQASPALGCLAAASIAPRHCDTTLIAQDSLVELLLPRRFAR